MNPRFRIILITLVVFLFAGLSYPYLADLAWYRTLPRIIRRLGEPVWWFLLCCAGLYLAHRMSLRQAWRELGLSGSAITGLVVGLVVTIPMWLPAIFLGRLSSTIEPSSLLFMAGIWPLGEELLFRGYTFRQLHRRAGMNLWAAAILTGAVFGAGHLMNATVRGMPLSDQLGTVAIISVGGVFFAWIFARWDDNLWVPWGVHAFMNLWWDVFDLADNPLGGWVPNAMRVLVVALAVMVTRRRMRVRQSLQRA